MTTNDQEVTIDGGATPDAATNREEKNKRMLVEENLEPTIPNIAQSAAEVAAEQDNSYKPEHFSNMTRDIGDEISAKEESIRPDHNAVEYINNE